MGKVMNHTPAILFVSLIELEELFFIEALQLVLGHTHTQIYPFQRDSRVNSA